MGLFKALAGVFIPEARIEATIDAQVLTYNQAALSHPKASHHDLLAAALATRWRAYGRTITDEAFAAAQAETLVYACLPVASALRALGIYICFKEGGAELMMKSSRHAAEYDTLMKDVLAVQDDAELASMYLKYNRVA